MRWIPRVGFLLAAVTPFAAPAQTTSRSAIQDIATHDNVQPAGRLEDGVLVLSLWAGTGHWYPEGRISPPRLVAAIGEAGRPLSIPSPLIRVPQGTRVQVTIRNSLASSLRVHGVCDRPGPCAPVTVPADSQREVRFTLQTAGTFHYWATTSDVPVLALREDEHSQLLGGAIVVDAPGARRDDRTFVLGWIRKPGGSRAELTVINGRTWPHTERLFHTVGDTVRWRVVNLTGVAHSMHLHGFYFEVESKGDGLVDSLYAAVDRRVAVTEQVPAGRAFTLKWFPERPGNWLFHCHMLEHMLPSDAQHASHGNSPALDSAAAGMGGLVLGVLVSGAAHGAGTPDSARRQLRVVLEPDSRHGATPGYKVDLVAGTAPPPRVSDRAVPGPVMVLTRGEPVAVEVVNRLADFTAIHWHGIELESYDDGVPGFGGAGGRVTPPIAPGGSFTARFTPSRAGTFIYHTHWHDPGQLSAGIYGPLIVLEPGQTYDPVTDHIIVIGLDGPYRTMPDEPFVVNGHAPPPPLDLKAGVKHRLRFINITADNVALTVQLLAGFDPIRWTLVGKDGNEVHGAQRKELPARQLVAVGETYDFELAPLRPGSGLWMELRRGSGELLFQWPVRVR